MKALLINYLLYVYDIHINTNNEDIYIFKDKYIPIIKVITWVINLYIWIFFITLIPITLPIYYIGIIVDKKLKNFKTELEGLMLNF